MRDLGEVAFVRGESALELRPSAASTAGAR
jgi:hypothetical protein